jgi:hypothetical protein
MTFENNEHKHNGEQDLSFNVTYLLKFGKQKLVYKQCSTTIDKLEINIHEQFVNKANARHVSLKKT